MIQIEIQIEIAPLSGRHRDRAERFRPDRAPEHVCSDIAHALRQEVAALLLCSKSRSK